MQKTLIDAQSIPVDRVDEKIIKAKLKLGIGIRVGLGIIRR